jgi:two-component system sensor histidine kinase HydH
MNARLFVRMTAPVVAISLLLLAVGVGAAWYVHHWQKTLAHEVRDNVKGMRAGEELEIFVRETRTRLDHFLITGDRTYLRQVPELRNEMERWLVQADRWAFTPREEELTSRARKGHERFWSALEQVTDQLPNAQAAIQVRALIDSVLVPEILEPAHDYLDLNEEEVEAAIDKSQVFADRLVYALLLLATCGSAAGLVAGFGFARGVNRSLIQLSVLIRDAAGQLNEDVRPISYSRGDMGELENVLRLITARVGTIVERLQEKEHEALQAEHLAAVGQLAAGRAHELRKPLMSMKILVQGALAGTCGEDDGADACLSSRDLVVLEEEITRLEQLIQSFFDFARPPVPEKRLMDVRPIIEQTIAFLSGRAAAASARIELHLPLTPAGATVDPGQFRQVLLNLVLNALDAMPAGGTITVELAVETDGGLTLQVADRGCGLPEALGERIFDPFTTTKATGLGLGLSICKRIATMHGGSLTAANRASGGAVFTLRLPASDAAHVMRNAKH